MAIQLSTKAIVFVYCSLSINLIGYENNGNSRMDINKNYQNFTIWWGLMINSLN